MDGQSITCFRRQYSKNSLTAVIHFKFERMHLQAHFFHFLALEIDVGGQQVVGENVALFEEVVVRLQRIQCLFERKGDLRDVVRFFRRQVVGSSNNSICF